MPYSIVVLLKGPNVFSEETLGEMAQLAFSVPYDGSSAMHFVSFDPALTVVKAGDYLIQVLQAAEPYLGDPAETAKGFRDARLAEAWRKHRAWIAFDLLNQDAPKQDAYKALSALAIETLDHESVGIYLPKENQFTIQSDGSAEKHLRWLSR